MKKYKLKEGKSTKEWETLYSDMEGVKTSVGVKLQDKMKEFQKALHIIAMEPSMIKPYLNDNYDMPEKEKINKLIDLAIGMDLLKAKFK